MRPRPSELAIAAAVGVSAIALVYAMLISERTAVHHALHVAAAESARPGDSVPVRAYLMLGVALGDNPTLVEGRVTVRLLSGEAVVARAELTPSSTLTAEGVLEVPPTPGNYVLEARAYGPLDAETLLASVRRDFDVTDDAPTAAELGRLAPLLSHFALGPLVIEPSQTPPPSLDARISAGVCVPDLPCDVLVDLGAVGWEVRLDPGPAVTVLGAPEVEGQYTRLSFRVTGAEGDVTLVALSAGIPVARRSLRLPVALATPWLDLPEPFVREGVLRARAAPPPGRTALLVDLASGDRFIRSFTLPTVETEEDGRRDVEIPFTDLPDGLYRVFLRSDPFPTDRLVGRVVRLGPSSAASPPLDTDGPIAFAFHGADLETSGLTLPRMVSGLEQDQTRIAAAQGTVRAVALSALLVAGVLLVLAIMRRGIAADADAVRLMAEVGAAENPHDRRHRRMTLIAAMLALGLALLTGVALIAARSLISG